MQFPFSHQIDIFINAYSLCTCSKLHAVCRITFSICSNYEKQGSLSIRFWKFLNIMKLGFCLFHFPLRKLRVIQHLGSAWGPVMLRQFWTGRTLFFVCWTYHREESFLTLSLFLLKIKIWCYRQYKNLDFYRFFFSNITILKTVLWL